MNKIVIWLCPECDMEDEANFNIREENVWSRGTCLKCGTKQAMLVRFFDNEQAKGFEHP